MEVERAALHQTRKLHVLVDQFSKHVSQNAARWFLRGISLWDQESWGKKSECEDNSHNLSCIKQLPQAVDNDDSSYSSRLLQKIM